MQFNNNQLAQYNQNFQQGLGSFMSSPAYMLAYGNDTSSNPAMNFMMNPGMQLANQQAMNAVGNSYTGKGLGNSGALAVGMQNAEYQNYNAYNQQQSALLGNYQSQLAALAGAGMGVSGGTQAQSNGQQLASLLSNANLQTGQGLSNLYQGVGNNISQLYGNEGAADTSAILNTGSAMANNLFNTTGLLAQINAANQASLTGMFNSAATGAGAAAGAPAATTPAATTPAATTPAKTTT